MHKILVVDDEPFFLEVLVELLQMSGFECIGAADGLEAIERAAESPPDLILTDLEMPRLDGFGLFERLRSDTRTAGIPVVAMTGHVERTDPRMQKLGKTVVLRKPFPVSSFLERVRVLFDNGGRPSA